MSDVDLGLSGDGALRRQLDDLKDAVEAPGSQGDWLVGTGVNYAVYVNFGTRDQDPQPFFTATVVEAQADLEAFVARHSRTTLEAADSAEEAAQLVAFALERRMKEKAPVDTGTLRASVKAVRGGTLSDLPTVDDVETDEEGTPIDQGAATVEVG